MNNEEALDAIIEQSVSSLEDNRTASQDKFVLNALHNKQKAQKQSLQTVSEATVIPKRDLYTQKKSIEAVAFDELQNILDNPDAKDSDKIKAISLVLKPHYPTTKVEIRAKVEDMGAKDLLEYLKQFKK